MSYRPGEKAPKTGQYKCSGCGHLEVVNKGETMPPCANCKKAGITWTLYKDLS